MELFYNFNFTLQLPQKIKAYKAAKLYMKNFQNSL